MSYYKELKDFILELKGNSFFLPPRDIWFLKFLEEEGYPIEVVREGIKRFYFFYPPEKRAKLPLFMSYREIRKINRVYVKSKKIDWKENFFKKLEKAKIILGEEVKYTEPKDMESAERILQELESKIAQKLWDSLNKEEKTKLMKKFSVFKENKELLKAMIKRELFRGIGLKSLSLFVD